MSAMRLALLGAVVVTLPLRGQGTGGAGRPSVTPQSAPPQTPMVRRGMTVIDVRGGKRLPDQAVVTVDNRGLGPRRYH